MQALKLCRLAEHLKFDPQPFETEQLKTLVLKSCQFWESKRLALGPQSSGILFFERETRVWDSY